jgi:hypothetical protein
MTNTDERSRFWGMAATGAVAGGFAYGMRGNWRDLYSAAKSPGITSSKKIAELHKSAVKYSQFGSSSIMGSLGNLAIDPRLGPQFGNELANLTYESIMGARVPVGHAKAQAAMRMVLQESAGGADSMSIYRSALSHIQAHGGDVSRFEKSIKGIVTDPGRLVSQSRFGDLSTLVSKSGVNERIGLEKLSQVERSEYESIISKLGSAEMLKGEIAANKISFHRVGTEGVAMARIPIKGAGHIDLPLSQSNIMYSGENFTNRYIARGAWEISGSVSSRKLETKTFNQHYIDTIAKSLTSGGQGRRPVKEAIHEANRMVIQNVMDNATDAVGKAAVWSPGEDMLVAGGYLKEQMTKNQLIYGGKALSPDLLEEAITLSTKMGKPLTPFLGAGAVGKGTLAMGDLRNQFYGPLGELFPAEKQPFQFIRGEWGLTENAMNMAEQYGQRFKGTFGEHNVRLLETGMGSKYADMIDAGGKAYVAPQLATVYTTGRKDVSGLIAEEMGIMSRSAAELQEYERITGVSIRAGKDMPAHTAIVKAMNSQAAIGETVMFESGVPLTKGELLGIDTKTNKRAFTGGAPGMSQELIGYRLTGDDSIKAIIKETHESTGSLPRKFFGREVKHMIQDVSNTQFKNILHNKIGFTQSNIFGEIEVEQLMTGSRIKKNPYALAKQQISAMDILISGSIDRAKGAEKHALQQAANPFFKDPTAFLADVFANNNIKSKDELAYQVQKRIMQQAQSFGLASEETGSLIFGLTSREHMNRMLQEKVISRTEVKAWKSAANVIGMSVPHLGDLAFEGGTGKMGTMDIAGFRMLAEKGYMGASDLGAMAAVDIAERTISPGSFKEISKMHGSIIGAESVSGKGAVDLATFQGSFVSKEGRTYNLGQKIEALGGAKRIYIPGINEAPQLTPALGATGEPISSQIHKELSGLRKAIKTGDTSLVNDAATRLARASHVEFARASTERGKVIGSRVLTGQQMTVAQQSTMVEGAIGVSEKTGTQMFKEMIEKAPESRRGFLQEQLSVFKSGKPVSALGWRHPQVGPESAQFVQFAAMQGAEESMVYMPRKMKEINVDGKLVTKDLSSLVGWKGDFDKDQFVLSAIGQQDVEKRVSNLLNNKIAENYNTYLGRHYAMERMINKNLGTDESLMRGVESLSKEARSHSYAKMATGQTNVALQQAKVAIANVMPEHYDELATAMWHIEETAAIGSKHGLVGGGELYKKLTSAIQGQSETEMENVFRSVFGEKQSVKSIVEGVETSVDYDPQIWSRRIIGSIKQSPSEVVESIKLSQLTTKGESRAVAKNMVNQYLMLAQGGSPDVSQVLAAGGSAERGIFEQAQGIGRGIRSRLRAVGQVLSRTKKPLMMGAAAAGVVALAAPSISGSITTNPNKEGAGGGRNINAADSIPSSGLEMNPPQNAIMRSPRNYEMGNMSSRVTGHYNATDLDSDRGIIMKQIQTMRANGLETRMNIKDNRSTLDPYLLANKIHERM